MLIDSKSVAKITWQNSYKAVLTRLFLAMLCSVLEDVELTNINRMFVHFVAGAYFSLEEFYLAEEELKAYIANTQK